MNKTGIRARRGWVLLSAVVIAWLAGSAQAAPRAGSVIGNQATASFVDGSGVTRTTTSNLVETLVAQVAGVDLEANRSKTSAPGATVYFPHTVTNTGNGNDVYNLSFTNNTGSFDFSTIAIYPDANADGIPDSFTPITVTPSLAPGQTYSVVVAAVVPGSASAGQSDNLTLTATSQFTGTITDSNADVVNVTANAVITVTKSEDLTIGPPGTTPVTITLTYTNTGNSSATNVAITDALPAGMSYITGSGRWSATTPTALTDAADGNEGGISYSTTGNIITATVASVAPGVSGFVRFQASINANAPAGLLPNTATLSYADGGGNTVTGNSNTVNFRVTPRAGVTLGDSGSTTDQDGAVNDVVSQGPAAQGAVLRYDNRLTNTGNAADTFNVTVTNTSYPAGTSFVLLQADGVTPLTDTDRDGVPDTGPIAPGASTSVFLKITLPSGASGTGPFDVIKRATSANDPTVSDTTTDRLTAITGSSVDLTNNSAGPTAPGAGPGPEANPVTTVTVVPGATASFTLFVNNTSAVPDAYDLAASTDRTFAGQTLPAGWTVTFRNSGGGVVTNTGTIAAGASVQITAEVRVPAGNGPLPTPGQSLYFRALSAASGAVDIKHDAVIVSPIRDLAITPNNVGQGFPGGAVTYVHTLTIDSSVAETNAPITVSNSQSGWNAVVYYDADGNGQIDATDPVITNLADLDARVPGAGLPPGSSYPLLVQVLVPSGAAAGLANTTTVTLGTVSGETNTANNTATDTTTVITGNVRLQKTQALDLGCDGAADTAFQTTALPNAIPGACLVYRVTATNAGTTPVTSLVISDATPPLTTYNRCGGACAASTTAGTVTAPADATSGTVTATVGTLAPNASATLTFTVRINP